jgi:hypothetical protein
MDYSLLLVIEKIEIDKEYIDHLKGSIFEKTSAKSYKPMELSTLMNPISDSIYDENPQDPSLMYIN